LPRARATLLRAELVTGRDERHGARDHTQPPRCDRGHHDTQRSRARLDWQTVTLMDAGGAGEAEREAMQTHIVLRRLVKQPLGRATVV